MKSSLNVLGLAALALLLAMAYLALAAWGYGGWRPLLASPARAAVAGGLLALAGMTPLCGCNLNAGRLSHSRNDWIFPVLLVAGLTMGWISAWSDRHNRLVIGAGAIRSLGAAMFFAGCVLRVAAMLILNDRFSVWVAIQHDHRLETTGLYRFIRHPSYTGAALTLLGWALTFRSAIGLVLAAMMALLLISRVQAEEQLLVAEFGDEYAEYQSRSWRLIPLVY